MNPDKPRHLVYGFAISCTGAMIWKWLFLMGFMSGVLKELRDHATKRDALK